jgi:pimeloyl-ACP methyl ester carboxylesterase
MDDIKTNGREAFIKKFVPTLFGDKDKMNEISGMLISRGLSYDDNAWYYGTQAIRDRNDHSQTLKNVNVPVLMIMGEQDKAVTPEIAYKQAPLTERAVLHMYPGVGHLAMYEHTSEMITDLIRFYGTHTA